MQLLIIIEHAYRGAVEGQYGHILWTCRSHQRMGGQLGVLLKGNAVLYARQCQTDPPLTIGAYTLTHLNAYGTSLETLIREGGRAYLFAPDAERLGLTPADLLQTATWVQPSDLPPLFSEYDAVWYW